MKKARFYLIGLVALSFAALAATITVYASDPRWNSLNNVAGTGISSELGIRSLGAFVIVRMHNETPAQSKPIQLGSTFKVVWQDGSSEQVKYQCNTSPAVCAKPVPGTQQAPSSGSGGGPYDDGGGYGPGDGGLGGTPYEDCFSDTVNACASVGGGPMYCETIPVLNCPP